MLRVARNEHVLRDVDSGAGTLLYRDDGQTIEEFVQYLLALLRGLRGDPVADPTWASPPMPPTAAAAAKELR